jgi:hypothetical protein
MKSKEVSWNHFLTNSDNVSGSVVISGVRNDRRMGTFTFMSSQIVLSGGTTCVIRGTTFKNASDMCHVIVFPCKNIIKTAFRSAQICSTRGQLINSLLHGGQAYEMTGSLKSVGNVRSYLTKYITKSDDNSDIEGRLWGCSYNLTKLSGPVEFADGQISQELDTLLQDHRVRIYKTDYYTVIYFDPGLLVILHLFLLLALIRQFCRTRFPDHYSPELFDP